MGRNVRIACVGTLVLLTGALVVQQGLGAPGPEPSIASDVRVGPDDDAVAQPSSRRVVDALGGRRDDGRRDDGRRDAGRRDAGRNDDRRNDDRRNDDRRKERGGPGGNGDRDDDGVQQVNPGAQTIDGDDGALDDTDDGGGGGDVDDDGGDD